MVSAAPSTFAYPKDLPAPGRRELAHVPGPSFGGSRTLNTVRALSDTLGEANRMLATWGPVHKQNSFVSWNVQVVGPEANELVLSNRDRIFSSTLGWNPILDRVFPRGLMLLDFDEHQLHRRALGVAFRPEPMQRYLATMNEGIARGVASWTASQPILFYPAIKKLTLDLAAASFLGLEMGPEADRINSSFIDMINASVGLVRSAVPGTAMWRGVRGREALSAFIRGEIARRRGSSGADIFTQLCNLDDGPPLSDQAIVDHINFLMLAAHDTVTSSLCSAVYLLARHPDWQERLREEIDALRAEHGPSLRYDRLDRLPLTEMAFKEALRLYPPVPSIPRRTLADVEIYGVRIPAGTYIGLSPMLTQRLPAIWSDPERFDPTRFTPENVAGRHRFAFIPFGGGAHLCIGMHYAYMQAKAFFFHLLSERRAVLEPGYDASFTWFPIPRPKDGLRVRLVARGGGF